MSNFSFDFLKKHYENVNYRKKLTNIAGRRIIGLVKNAHCDQRDPFGHGRQSLPLRKPAGVRPAAGAAENLEIRRLSAI